ncbi:haloacid dehalogenase type II [Marivirga sp.]|uniref:haloacid dehalogenase type II n=1 Tax=Marivirga sp. TaxID=2018662 RepID=UPI0025CF2D2B|nr:haloacid dehalogenase type II [Marivirga sp.]
MRKPKLLVFDVNETLLDLEKIKVKIQDKFQDKTSFSLWFATLLQYSMVKSITNQYHSFGEIGKSTLRMTAEKLNKNISEEEISGILSLITELPPHPEVKSALEKFQSMNYQIIALTNGSLEAVKAQMKFAGIDQYFERLFSVEEVKSFKPQPITYQYVLKEMNIAAEEALMIAAHPWDLAGAKAVGMQTAFIERPSQVYYPLLEKADFMVKNLEELVERLK